MTGALHGIKVVELARFIAGPYCGLLLADMGAEVIKVERPGGEDSRKFAPFHNGESLYAAALNRNKRSITLNYRHPMARNVLTRLFQWADIIIENFRPGTMESMGFGFDKIQEINPKAILVRCSGFGQTGPLNHRPGFDAIGQAMGGVMWMTGRAEDPPLMAGVFVADYATGMHAAVGALAALHNREKTGRGQVVDVSLLESVVSMLVSAIPDNALHGNEPPRMGNRDRYAAPSNAYRTKDGWVFIAASNDGLWERLCGVMGRPDLLERDEFKTVSLRYANVEEVDRIVGEWAAGLTEEHVLRLLDEAGIPCAPIRNIRQILNDPHLWERGQITETTLPDGTKIPVSGVTIKLSETPGSLRYPVPAAGQHNEEVYRHILGFSEAEWLELKGKGVC
ncbi:MAG: hypothetical protein BAA01_09815 [Bacillus thermozeamaize]|uniref:Formyl-CoA transferase n=1 Tax=Bacillus thermozeamaize TaxID=230954 RepID=A0A1Y3PNH0_9BACI|nr:MAG: hypothetical protein BAA01_09815 [Bacillus thermozeamaize]